MVYPTFLNSVILEDSNTAIDAYNDVKSITISRLCFILRSIIFKIIACKNLKIWVMSSIESIRTISPIIMRNLKILMTLTISYMPAI